MTNREGYHVETNAGGGWKVLCYVTPNLGEIRPRRWATAEAAVQYVRSNGAERNVCRLVDYPAGLVMSEVFSNDVGGSDLKFRLPYWTGGLTSPRARQAARELSAAFAKNRSYNAPAEAEPEISQKRESHFAASKIREKIDQIESEVWHNEASRKSVLVGLRMAKAKVLGQDVGVANSPYEIEKLVDYVADVGDKLTVEKQVHRDTGRTRIQVTLPDGRYVVMNPEGWRLWDQPKGVATRKGTWMP